MFGLNAPRQEHESHKLLPPDSHSTVHNMAFNDSKKQMVSNRSAPTATKRVKGIQKESQSMQIYANIPRKAFWQLTVAAVSGLFQKMCRPECGNRETIRMLHLYPLQGFPKSAQNLISLQFSALCQLAFKMRWWPACKKFHAPSTCGFC